MKQQFIAIGFISLFAQMLSAQLANWTAYKPEKFPARNTSQVHNEGSARISQMKFHHSNPNKFYAVSSRGGLFTTADAGENWVVSPGTDAIDMNFASICVDYSNDQIIYLGSGDPDNGGGGNGMYKSTNGGASFTRLNTFPISYAVVFEILMHPTNPNIIVAGTHQGIYKSFDGGATWLTKSNQYFTGMRAVAHANSRTMYASTGAPNPIFYRSDNFGDSWTQLTNGITYPTSTNAFGSRIAVTPADTNVVYLGFVTSGGVILKSTDKGMNFTVVKPEGSPYLTYYDNYAHSYSQGNYNYCIGVDHVDANKIWLQSQGTWYSANGGRDWTMQTYWTDNLHTDMHEILQSPHAPTKLYSCNDGGVYLSENGGNTWTPKSDGIFAYEIGGEAGKSSPTDKDFISIGTQDNGTLFADATGWTKTGGGDDYTHREIDKRPLSNAVYRIAGNGGGGSGQRIINARGNSSSYNSPSEKVSKIIFNRTDINLAFLGLGATGQRQIYRSTNLQNSAPTWVQISNFSGDALIMSIHSCIANPNRLYVITNDQKVYVSNNALSASPTFSDYTLPSSTNDIATITAIANNADLVYTSINNKVYRSSDGGQIWTDITYNLPSVNHRRILSEEYGGTEELVFIATNNAVYYKKAGQTTWTNYSTNLPARRAPTDFSIFDDGTKEAVIRYASFGRGIWQSPISNLRPFAAISTVSKNMDPCMGNNFTFKNGSTGVYTAVSWSFPGGSPSTSTAENPSVTYASVGNYTATLTVTDANNNTSSINIPVNVTRIDNCTADPYAGKALTMTAYGDHFVKRDANLSNVTHFSTTAWIKPDGQQTRMAGIVSNGVYSPNTPDNTCGFIIDYYQSKLWYRWAGIDDNWAGFSDLTVPLNEWSYVAMVITPDSVALYLNDKKYVNIFSGSSDRPTAGNFKDLYVGFGHYDGPNFKGQIDEVTVWDRALTQNEIRDMRHLTKESPLANDPNLRAYFQFNDVFNNVYGENIVVLDKKRAYHGVLQGGATLTTSNAPVGGGVSERQNITNGGLKTFATPKVDLEFPIGGTLPNGEIVVTRLNRSPDQKPTGGSPLNNPYWIVNNYGTNAVFSPLTSLKLNDVGSLLSPASNYKLYKRTANAEGATWGTNIDGGDNLTGSNLTFTPPTPCLGISDFGQFTFNDDAATAPPSPASAECALSTVIGKAYNSTTNGDYLQTSTISLNKADGRNNNEVTLMAWVKPNGIQSPDCAIIGTTAGNVEIIVRSNNGLGIIWNGGYWDWSSGLTLPSNEWSHVAFVITPTQFKLYLNGKEAVNSNVPVALDLVTTWRIGIDRNQTHRTFKGLIDEVCLYNRSLPINEIREKMHLMKNPATDASLRGYFQFNETSGLAWNKSPIAGSGTFSGVATRANSTAPVAVGTSQRMSITTGGVKDFSAQNVLLEFQSSGTLPNGDIVVNELTAAPDPLPSGGTPLSNKYWIVNNYGTNQAFSPLTSLKFSNLGTFATGLSSNYKLYKRIANSDAAWGASIDAADDLTTANNNTLTFSTNNGITSFSQLTIAKEEVKLSMKVFLEGTYNGSTMRTDLANTMPLTEPYTGMLPFTHQNGGGGETTTRSIITTNAIVDWVLVELTASGGTVYTRSALLQADGDIVDVDGVSPLLFSKAALGSYTVTVKHRNHLKIKTNAAVLIESGGLTLNFTNGSTPITGILKTLSAGLYGMYGGDINQDGSIDALDRSLTWNHRNLTGYIPSDCSLNGTVDATDRSTTWNHRNISSGF